MGETAVVHMHKIPEDVKVDAHKIEQICFWPGPADPAPRLAARTVVADSSKGQPTGLRLAAGLVPVPAVPTRNVKAFKALTFALSES